MREYQPKRNNPYLLPHNLYMRVLYTIRDYDRMHEEYMDILHGSSGPSDGLPRGSETSDTTAQKGIKLAAISGELKAIEQALVSVPAEYRKGVFDNVRYGGWYPIDAHERTYRSWKQRFIYYAAKNLQFL